MRELVRHTLKEVTFSNSMIEAWWRVLKHQWLYLNTLDTLVAVERLMAFYVVGHNTKIPHSAFRGKTPDEMYAGRGTDVANTITGKKAGPNRPHDGQPSTKLPGLPT